MKHRLSLKRKETHYHLNMRVTEHIFETVSSGRYPWCSTGLFTLEVIEIIGVKNGVQKKKKERGLKREKLKPRFISHLCIAGQLLCEVGMNARQ